MKKLSAVVVNLQSPKEKVWGILLSIHASGLTVRGIELNSFDDWSRGVARGEREMGLATTFFPLHRVERIHLDESVGTILSLHETFEARVGQDVWSYLGMKRGLPRDVEPSAGAGQEWMTLRGAESDYIERVLSDAEWDRAAAAEILDISEADLAQKITAYGLRPDTEETSK
jgi:hypothetical protein